VSFVTLNAAIDEIGHCVGLGGRALQALLAFKVFLYGDAVVAGVQFGQPRPAPARRTTKARATSKVRKPKPSPPPYKARAVRERRRESGRVERAHDNREAHAHH